LYLSDLYCLIEKGRILSSTVGYEASKRKKTMLLKELDDNDEVVCGTAALAFGGSNDLGAKLTVCSII
jgi:hypothetical protein